MGRLWTSVSGVIVGALLVWAYLLYRMVASSPSTSHHSPGDKCLVSARVLWAPHVILPSADGAGAVHIESNGLVAAAWLCSRAEAEDYAEARSLPFEPRDAEVISPGIVDTAAHLAEWLEPPGRSYEGFASGTQAAAAGGITTVIDLPAHARPLTTNTAALRRKIDGARGHLHVDVGFWGAALPEGLSDGSIENVLHGGALGLAVVVAASSFVEQPGVVTGSRALTLEELERVIDVAAQTGKPVLVHAEFVSDDDAGLPAGADGMDYASWLATRPMRYAMAFSCLKWLLRPYYTLPLTQISRTLRSDRNPGGKRVRSVHCSPLLQSLESHSHHESTCSG